jgi:hypothetical protein
MPHPAASSIKTSSHDRRAPRNKSAQKSDSRHTVGLDKQVVREVEQYAALTDVSMSKAIAALVRLGLESQERRKREFFGKLKDNLANDDPKQQDRLVEEFRALILGR